MERYCIECGKRLRFRFIPFCCFGKIYRIREGALTPTRTPERPPAPTRLVNL